MAAPPPPRIATFEECLSIIGELPHDTVIDAMATGFVAYSRGEVSVPPIQSLGQPPYANFVGHPDAQACIKSAYVHGGAVFVMKVASGGGGRNSGMVLVFSQVHFAPVAIFLDNGYLTELRTAAAGALAAREFAPRSLSRIAIIGCGIQARWQLRLLTEVVACRTVVCYARRPEQAAELVQEMGKEGWEISAAPTIAAACDGAGLIVTVTPAREPLLQRAWVTSGDVLVNCIGADCPGKQELDPSLLTRASMVLSDATAQCVERGELQHCVKSGALASSSVVEIGEWLARPAEARVRPAGLVIFDSTGVAVQDVKIAELALNVATPSAPPKSHAKSAL